MKLITTKESWDQKIAEAETDKKLVSTSVTLLLLLDASIAPSYMNASTCIACIDMWRVKFHLFLHPIAGKTKFIPSSITVTERIYSSSYQTHRLHCHQY